MKRTKRFKKKKKLWIIPAALLVITIFTVLYLLYRTDANNTDLIEETEKDRITEPDKVNNDNAEKKPEDKPETEIKKMQVDPSCLPENFDFFSEVIVDGKVVERYVRDQEIIFPDSGDYSMLPGITCFRGNNYRNSAGYGYVDVTEEKLEKVWFSKTGYIDIWTGVGWTGQPAVVKWDDSVRNMMNLSPSKKQKKGLKEVIYATLDGKIYFLDLDDGTPTRSPINTGYPYKGSVVVDPRGFPLLYAGQGIPEKEGKQVPIGYRIYSLIDHKMLYFINGYDKDAFRRWGAFDSGALIDGRTDTLIECGENGILYTINMNTVFNKEKSEISISPQEVKYRYRSPFGSKIGTENSPVVYKNYIYFADNSGLLQCVDLNTLKPVWIRDVSDDTDSSPVIEEISETEVYLYTACEVDSQGENGYSFIRKIHALTGELIWEKAVQCHYHPDTNGGALASPVLGKNDIENLIIFNLARTGSNKNSGRLIAIDKKTGKEVWSVDMKYYCWSSPADIYTEEGKSYLLVCDSGGYMRLLEGISGKELDSIPLEANIEASPAVYHDMIVVGTRGQKIWGIRIK